MTLRFFLGYWRSFHFKIDPESWTNNIYVPYVAHGLIFQGIRCAPDFSSLVFQATCTMRTGPWMTFLVNLRNKLLMHITMAYVMLGHICFPFAWVWFLLSYPQRLLQLPLLLSSQPLQRTSMAPGSAWFASEWKEIGLSWEKYLENTWCAQVPVSKYICIYGYSGG